MSTNAQTSSRSLVQVLPARDTSDGDGVKIRRIAGRNINTLLDPFLMLDEIRSDDSKDYLGGFPPHPHRGFETVTYILQGGFTHKDHLGNEGHVGAGGAQWMTAGHGIIHEEMPLDDSGLMHGFQLWLNLPASEKMRAPDWQDIQSDAMDKAVVGPHHISVIAGEFSAFTANEDHTINQQHTTQLIGPKQSVTQAIIADVQLHPQEPLTLVLPADNTVLVYVIEGALSNHSSLLQAGHMGVFSEGNTLTLQGDTETRVLLLAGKPLREPIAQYGPFVMNTTDEIEQAINDYNEEVLTQMA